MVGVSGLSDTDNHLFSIQIAPLHFFCLAYVSQPLGNPFHVPSLARDISSLSQTWNHTVAPFCPNQQSWCNNRWTCQSWCSLSVINSALCRLSTFYTDSSGVCSKQNSHIPHKYAAEKARWVKHKPVYGLPSRFPFAFSSHCLSPFPCRHRSVGISLAGRKPLKRHQFMPRNPAGFPGFRKVKENEKTKAQAEQQICFFSSQEAYAELQEFSKWFKR